MKWLDEAKSLGNKKSISNVKRIDIESFSPFAAGIEE